MFKQQQHQHFTSEIKLLVSGMPYLWLSRRQEEVSIPLTSEALHPLLILLCPPSTFAVFKATCSSEHIASITEIALTLGGLARKRCDTAFFLQTYVKSNHLQFSHIGWDMRCRCLDNYINKSEEYSPRSTNSPLHPQSSSLREGPMSFQHLSVAARSRMPNVIGVLPFRAICIMLLAFEPVHWCMRQVLWQDFH